MKVVSFGSNFQIYPDDLKTYDELPAHTYRVNFSPQQGFSLSKSNDFEQKEDIYGNHMEKIDKIMRSYAATDRSLGTILSGNKGIGKSIFLQLLSERAIESGIPVILVQDAYPGISHFIESIEQEALILFDEFEKVFNEQDDEIESQDKLLGLFDGTSQFKRLYAITVNNLYRVSDYMINRPGRFHYHLRFEYPSSDEIRSYLEDKIHESYYNQIDHVIAFSSKVPLNYDCLRALAFELNMGEPFNEAIKDLNIINTELTEYRMVIKFKSGHKDIPSIIRTDESLNLFESSTDMVIHSRNHDFSVRFSFENSKLEHTQNGMLVSGSDVTSEFYFDEDEEYDVQIESVEIAPNKSNNIHYTV